MITQHLTLLARRTVGHGQAAHQQSSDDPHVSTKLHLMRSRCSSAHLRTTLLLRVVSDRVEEGKRKGVTLPYQAGTGQTLGISGLCGPFLWLLRWQLYLQTLKSGRSTIQLILLPTAVKRCSKYSCEGELSIRCVNLAINFMPT